MPQSILIQVGQCGNQLGDRFWQLALQEEQQLRTLMNSEKSSGKSTVSLATDTFFRFVDKSGAPVDSGSMNSTTQLRARGVLIDMEESVIGHTTSASHRPKQLFSPEQCITSTDGSGNNWAVGYYHYGSLYAEKIEDCIRQQAEHCDCLQSFFLLNSTGGGTGSGLGSYVLELVADRFPDVYRFSTCVLPSHSDDDVITSPYNSVLSLNKMTEYADCVIPIENQALLDIVQSQQQSNVRTFAPESSSKGINGKEGSAFDKMNDIVAGVLMNLTSSMRFEGELNVDLNEISMNLVPFPRLKYLTTALTSVPYAAGGGVSQHRIDQMFMDSCQKSHQLIKSDPKHALYLACALLLRTNGPKTINSRTGVCSLPGLSDMRRNIEKLKKNLKFVVWNEDGWKTGLCCAPVAANKELCSLLTLANNCGIREPFSHLQTRFQKLYKRKAHLYHYTKESMDQQEFNDAYQNLDRVIQEYDNLNVSYVTGSFESMSLGKNASGSLVTAEELERVLNRPF